MVEQVIVSEGNPWPGRMSNAGTAFYEFNALSHHLTLFMDSPTPAQIETLSDGNADVRFFGLEGLMLLLCRFTSVTGTNTPGFLAVYRWQDVAESYRMIPEEMPTLQVACVDTKTKIVKSMRTLDFPPHFEKVWLEALRMQSLADEDALLEAEIFVKEAQNLSYAQLAHVAAGIQLGNGKKPFAVPLVVGSALLVRVTDAWCQQLARDPVRGRLSFLRALWPEKPA